jgi:hypothetical protein
MLGSPPRFSGYGRPSVANPGGYQYAEGMLHQGRENEEHPIVCPDQVPDGG